ncbi:MULTISPECIES: DUF4232 domain-containing protein [unclassified Streptomyces]|uniref:DUF4232 domain-containing protein n=1 Tax=unclassified Streptomyces TaxID=2593676 RepID=UPI003792BD8E
MRTFRTRTTTAAATALLAALSLTACQNGGSDTGAAAPGATSTAAPAPAGAATPVGAARPGTSGDQAGTAATPAGGTGKGSTGGNGSTGKDGAGSAKPKPASPAAGGGTSDPASFTTCTSANTKVTVSRPSRPINHLLITATNTGTRTCLAYAAPLLRFDDEQSTPRLVESSRPQAVVTLAPGESAYAGVILSGERAPEEANGRVTERLSVLFNSRDESGSVGAPTTVTLPADTYKTDDAAVTYWQDDLADALMY